MSFRTARATAGLTLEEISKAVNVSITAVHHWETGKALPRADRLIRLSEILHCDIRDLLTENKET